MALLRFKPAQSGKVHRTSKTDDIHSGMGSVDHVCRICWGEEHKEYAGGDLVSPCMCSGSMKYVHISCLAKWQSQLCLQKGILASRKCDVCKARWDPEYRGLSQTSKSRWSKVVFMAQSLQPCLLTIIEWWKAVVVARGVLTAIEAGAAGFRLGLQFRHLGAPQQHDLMSLLQWMPFSMWATGTMAPIAHLPAVLLVYAAARGAAALQGTVMAVAGLYAGTISGFASGVGNTLLHSLHVIGGVAGVGVGGVHHVIRFLTRFFMVAR